MNILWNKRDGNRSIRTRRKKTARKIERKGRGREKKQLSRKTGPKRHDVSKHSIESASYTNHNKYYCATFQICG